MSEPSVYTLETGENPTAVVIWLHGLGADGSDFPPAVPYLHLPDDLAVRFLFPNAPMQPVTINGGYVMRSWYDILSMDNGREINPEQLAQSVAYTTGLIEQQVAQGIAPERILLVGFSQGGAVAYETALAYRESLGGVAALSTYLPRALTEVSPVAPTTLPVLIQHGEGDDVVLLSMGQAANAQLERVGFTPVWKTYPMGHEVSEASLADLGQWLTSYLK